MQPITDIPNLALAYPELWLAVGAMVLLMIGTYSGGNSTRRVTGLSVALLVISGIWLVYLTGDGTAFHGAFVLDSFARFMKVLVLIGSGLAIAMSVSFARVENFSHFEYPILIILATTGMMLMISAADLLTLYLGLELQSLALYVIAAINRDSIKSTEAGLKYFVLGALSSGMLLYGASLIYGFTGQTGFAEIAVPRLVLSLAWYFCWPASHSRSLQFPSICGRPMFMKVRPHR